MSASSTITRRSNVELGLVAAILAFLIGTAWKASDVVSSFRADVQHITETLSKIEVALQKNTDGINKLYLMTGEHKTRIEVLEDRVEKIENRLK